MIVESIRYFLVLLTILFPCQLAALQSKVRSDVSSEYWLRVNCVYPDKQLFDWGMMRFRRPLYGVGDAFATEAEDPLKKKRNAEVILLFIFYLFWLQSLNFVILFWGYGPHNFILYAKCLALPF